MNTKQSIHDYHLLVDIELKQKIYDVQNFDGWSFTDRTRFMLKTCSFVVYAYYQEIRKANSLIPVRIDGPVDAHIYFPVSEYRYLKEKHGMHNTFSVAVMVRTVMRLFLEGIAQYGFYEFIAMMEELKENMDKSMKKRMRIMIQKIGRHMCALFEKLTQLFAEFLLKMAFHLLM